LLGQDLDSDADGSLFEPGSQLERPFEAKSIRDLQRKEFQPYEIGPDLDNPITGGLVGIIGDLLAEKAKQKLEDNAGGGKPVENDSDDSSTTTTTYGVTDDGRATKTTTTEHGDGSTTKTVSTDDTKAANGPVTNTTTTTDANGKTTTKETVTSPTGGTYTESKPEEKPAKEEPVSGSDDGNSSSGEAPGAEVKEEVPNGGYSKQGYY